MQNVSTRRRDRINSDEEERLRVGYELRTALRFAERQGVISARRAELRTANGALLATLTYGAGTSIRRINLGWRRRRDQGRYGFELDLERGYWGAGKFGQDDDPDDAATAHQAVVVPYVQDTRNALLIEPAVPMRMETMAALQAALQRGMQAVLEVEDRELAAEPLPSADERRLLLFYEAAEGGAGVLRRLVRDDTLFPRILAEALEICHFDADGTDQERGPGSEEACEAACYQCLLSYGNQRDHQHLDRHIAASILIRWLCGQLSISPAPRSRTEHVQLLLRRCDSELERRWVRMLDRRGLRLPSYAQQRNEVAGARPDFVYREEGVAIFIDGPHHDTARQQALDEAVNLRLFEYGILSVRFHHAGDWLGVVRQHPDVFGVVPEESPTADTPETAEPEELDLDDFDEPWHPVVLALSEREGILVEPGGDVTQNGRVVGPTIAEVRSGERVVFLVDADDPIATAVMAALKGMGKVAVSGVANAPELMSVVIAGLEE